MVQIRYNVCGELKEHHGYGMCGTCYRKQYNENHHEEKRIKAIQYHKDHHEKINKRKREWYKDHREYRKQRYDSLHTSGGSISNKDCPQYLGCTIAETVLSHVFKNVQKMPTHNPGYDLICGGGYKIDVKSSCIIKRKGRLDNWLFNINQNTIADYFIYLAFNNRKDLNPLHIWLIPGHVINHLMGAAISVSTLNKWSEYEQPLDKVLECCNTMRGDK